MSSKILIFNQDKCLTRRMQTPIQNIKYHSKYIKYIIKNISDQYLLQISTSLQKKYIKNLLWNLLWNIPIENSIVNSSKLPFTFIIEYELLIDTGGSSPVINREIAFQLFSEYIFYFNFKLTECNKSFQSTQALPKNFFNFSLLETLNPFDL